MNEEQTVYLERIKKDPAAFKDVPQELATEEFCFAAVLVNANALSYLPPGLKDKALFISVVNTAAQFPPEYRLTPYEVMLFHHATRTRIKSIEAKQAQAKEAEERGIVEPDENANEVGDEAEEGNDDYHKDFTYNDWVSEAADGGIDWDNPPPPEMLTEELCIAALQDAPEHLGKMPLHLRTPEVCFAAVYIDDDALRFVPDKLRAEVAARKDAITEAQWLDDLKHYSGNHYLKLPEKLLTPEFCRKLVGQNGLTIRLIPEGKQSGELKALAAESYARWKGK